MFIVDGNVDIHALDIPVNAVATALKDFFSKRLPPLIDKERMSELEDISGTLSNISIVSLSQERSAKLFYPFN